MTYIIDGLYLGDLEDACSTANLVEKGITHILTVDIKPLYRDKREDFGYQHIQAQDMESTDLLSHFPECIQFMEEGRQQGGVLVHCLAGVSRSAAVVLAYIMQKLDLSVDDAFTLVKKQRPQIRPNPGFVIQLELYRDMGCRLDPAHPQYKQFRLNNIAQMMHSAQSCDRLPEDALSADPGVVVPAKGTTLYKCKKCRRPLFRESCIMPHPVGPGSSAFDWRSSQAQNIPEEGATCKQSLFIEPVAWMASKILEFQGKLSCPKCQAKLGSFDWKGERCPCGTWVTPAFHIQNNKVDETHSGGAPSSVTASRLAGPQRALMQTTHSPDGSAMENSRILTP